MTKLLGTIRTEWLKLRHYPAFWWVFGITALTYPGINSMFLYIYLDIVDQRTQAGKMVQMLIGDPFTFPEVWRTVAYFSMLFIYIPAILVIMLITNEYTYKTHRQNIIDGWTRQRFMTGKLIDVLLVSLLVTVLYTITAYVMGMVETKTLPVDKWSLAYYAGLFGLATFAHLSVAFLFGLVLRRSFIALSAFTFYGLIFENIASKFIQFKLKQGWWEYLPLEISRNLLPRPAFIGRLDEAGYKTALAMVQPHIWMSIGFCILVWGISYLYFLKKDI